MLYDLAMIMDEIKSDLNHLTQLLCEELGHERRPVHLSCDSCKSLRHELEGSQKLNTNLQERIRGLEKQVNHSQQLKSENDALRSQLAHTQGHPSYQSVVGELAIEKQRRLKAEQELEIYRKQGKTSEEKAAANAKRVAIALAHHCVELSSELERLRATNSRDSHLRDSGKKVLDPILKNVDVKAKASGWDIDDDIFDESN